jgi:hypothetical protein
LRAAQDFDALQLHEIALQETGVVDRDAVDVRLDARQAADGRAREAIRHRSGVEHDVRNHDAEVATRVDARDLELLTSQRVHRHRRLLQIRRDARRRYDDLVEHGVAPCVVLRNRGSHKECQHAGGW